MSNIFQVTSPDQILRHQLNDSKSKFHYSFSKDSRFKQQKTWCAKSFYEVSPKKNQRAAGLGYGKKSDFTKTTCFNYAPSANYDLKSKFDINRKIRSGSTFGTSRENMKNQGYIPLSQLYTPSPTLYQGSKKQKNILYSLRPKTAHLQNPNFLGGKYTSTESPGPGAYSVEPAISQKGSYTQSKYKGSGSVSFNPPQSKRFKKHQNGIPGPNQYHLKSPPTVGTRSFGSETRTSFVDKAAKNSITPGVGAYQRYSDFGQNCSLFDMKSRSKMLSSSIDTSKYNNTIY